MTELHNLTALKAADTIIDLVVVANEATNQIFIGSFLIGIYVIMVMGLSKKGYVNAILASSFVCFFLSIFLRTAGLINFLYSLAFLTIMAGLSLWKVAARNN